MDGINNRFPTARRSRPTQDDRGGTIYYDPKVPPLNTGHLIPLRVPYLPDFPNLEGMDPAKVPLHMCLHGGQDGYVYRRFVTTGKISITGLRTRPLVHVLRHLDNFFVDNELNPNQVLEALSTDAEAHSRANPGTTPFQARSVVLAQRVFEMCKQIGDPTTASTPSAAEVESTKRANADLRAEVIQFGKECDQLKVELREAQGRLEIERLRQAPREPRPTSRPPRSPLRSPPSRRGRSRSPRDRRRSSPHPPRGTLRRGTRANSPRSSRRDSRARRPSPLRSSPSAGARARLLGRDAREVVQARAEAQCFSLSDWNPPNRAGAGSDASRLAEDAAARIPATLTDPQVQALIDKFCTTASERHDLARFIDECVGYFANLDIGMTVKSDRMAQLRLYLSTWGVGPLNKSVTDRSMCRLLALCRVYAESKVTARLAREGRRTSG